MNKSKKAVVLMTALVPTIGHEALIKFAGELVGPYGSVDVIVSGRSFEPVPLHYRVDALQEAAYRLFPDNYGTYIFVDAHFDDNAPQNPATDEEWDYWKKIATDDGYEMYDYFVASEPYGKKMAELIGAEFVPFDIDREIFTDVKGSTVRENLDALFHWVLPEFRHYLRKTVTMFGQESVGKTTMTEIMGFNYGLGIHEFARPYLESMDDKTVTLEKMDTIMRGQYALQKAAENAATMITIQDTDLLSTIGYYRIFGHKEPDEIRSLFQETKSDLYVLLSDDIPFEPDPLRYGGDKRESTLQFWIDLLEEFYCNYVIVDSNSEIDREEQVFTLIDAAIEEWVAPIRDFVRD